jgi:epoxide hydrolase 4
MSISTGRFIEVAPDVQLHCASIGLDDHHKPLLVLLHGFPEFWQGWFDVMPLLAAHYRVVAPDLRGFNLSSKPVGVRAYAVKHIVADVLKLIQVLQSEAAQIKQTNPRVVLAAHDWGGAVAWNLAAAHGKVISELVIVNSPHPLTFWQALCHDTEQQQASQYMNWLRRPGCEVALAENNFERLEGFFLKMGKADWFTGLVREQYHAAWGQPRAIEGGCNYYRASPLHPPTEQEPGPLNIHLDEKQFFITVPTLLIWGDADIALRPVLIEDLDRHFSHLTIERFAQQSHWILHETPNQVANCMLKWLAIAR